MSTINGITVAQVDILCDSSYTLATNLVSVDGIDLQTGDTVLFTKLTDKTKNGLYTASITLGVVTWTRTTGYTTSADFLSGLFVEVTNGTAYTDSLWFVEPNAGFILNTDPLYFRPTKVSAILATQSQSTGAINIGTVSIDQSVPGTSNAVVLKIAGAFANITSATLSNVASSASSVTIIASNTNRRKIIVCNDSTSRLLLKFGATASATDFTIALAGGAIYESPFGAVYTGIIDGIWDSANGAARVTEMI